MFFHYLSHKICTVLLCFKPFHTWLIYQREYEAKSSKYPPKYIIYMCVCMS